MFSCKITLNKVKEQNVLNKMFNTKCSCRVYVEVDKEISPLGLGREL
jgi:hypothetical protein